MYCANCGNELVKNAVFCSSCGKKVPNTEHNKDEKVVTVEVEYQKASQGKRFLNFIIDYYIVSWLLSSVVAVLLQYESFLIIWLISVLSIILYFTFFEAFTGKTLGKLVTGTTVLNLENERPPIGQVFIRTLCRFIPFDSFTYLTSSRPVGWHDSISKTYVAEKVNS